MYFKICLLTGRDTKAYNSVTQLVREARRQCPDEGVVARVMALECRASKL